MHKLVIYTYILFLFKKINFVVFDQAYAYHTYSEAFSCILQGYLTHFHQNRLASLAYSIKKKHCSAKFHSQCQPNCIYRQRQTNTLNEWMNKQGVSMCKSIICNFLMWEIMNIEWPPWHFCHLQSSSDAGHSRVKVLSFLVNCLMPPGIHDRLTLHVSIV